MNTDILKNSASNNREIDTDSLKIYGNCLEFKDTVIQLSNVSLVANNPIAPPQFPIWAAVAFIVGLLFLFVDTDIDIIPIVGFFCSLEASLLSVPGICAPSGIRRSKGW